MVFYGYKGIMSPSQMRNKIDLLLPMRTGMC